MSGTILLCTNCGYPVAWCTCSPEIKKEKMDRIQTKGESNPAIKALRKRVDELEDQIRGLELSGNPEDWKRAHTQRLIVMGFLEAISILRQSLDDEE